MVLSMTGYGSHSRQQGETAVAVEVRAVNHRFLDLHVRLGREYVFLETDIQQIVRGAVSRGRIDVSVAIQSAGPSEMLIDIAMAKGYLEAAGRLREEFQLSDGLDLKTLLSLPGVLQDRGLKPAENIREDGLREVVITAVRCALQSVLQMRKQEGEALKADMRCYLASIGDKNRSIRALLPSTVEEYRTRLATRLDQLLPQKDLDPQRLVQEVAILVERSDISEEVARLESHIGQYNDLLEAAGEAGKKLDFLLQEMQREVNTVLSKTGNLEITRLGIAIKADIEKLREQVQNVE